MIKIKYVNFKLDCGYKIHANVRVIPADKNKGTTVTIVSAHLPKMEDLLIQIMNENKIFFSYDFIKSLDYRHEVKGKAVCDPEDTYDETYGISLATARLQARMNEMVNKRLIKVINVLQNAINKPIFDCCMVEEDYD